MNLHVNNFLAMLLIAASLTCGMAMSATAAEQSAYQRSVERYPVPPVTLVNQDGKKVRFAELLQSDKPVAIQFIFATCTTICPVLSAGYVNLQQKMGENSSKVHLVSISIDPENDSPKIMKEYLKRYRAKPGWDFLTGSRKDIDAVMRAFNAYIPNKMSHYALTFIRAPKDDKWVRLYGIMSSSEFANEGKKVGMQ